MSTNVATSGQDQPTLTQTIDNVGAAVVSDTAAAILGEAAALAANTALITINVTGGSAATSNPFALGHAQTLNLGTSTLTLNGATTLTSTSTASPLIAGNAGSAMVTTQTTTLDGLILGNAASWTNRGTATQTGGVQLGSAPGSTASLVNDVSGTYDIAGDGGIAAFAGGSQTLVNKGTLAKTDGWGVSHITANTTDTGTLSVASGNLRFDGKQNSFSGTYVGPAMIDYGIGSTSTLGTIAMTERACSTNFGTVNQGGVVTLGDGSTINNLAASTWTLLDKASLATAEGASTPLFINSGTLAKPTGTGTATVAVSINDGGITTVASGALAFAGATNEFTGSIVGAGTLVFAGGSSTIGSGATIATAGLALAGSGTLVTLAEDLTYAGTLSTGVGTTLALSGNTLTLSGPATVSGTVRGPGTMALGSSLTVAGTISGGTLALAAGSQALRIARGAVMGDTISGLAATDTIDFQGLFYAPTDGMSFAVTAAGGTVNILDTAHANAVRASFTVTGSYDNGQFTLAGDGATGTTVGLATIPSLGLVAGDTVVSRFAIGGQSYTGTLYVYDATKSLVAARYTGVKGQAYQAIETDYGSGGVTGTRYFYTGLTGKPYTTETLTVNAAGQQTAVAFGGLTGAPYASYEYNYAAGLFAGSRFAYTAVPAGAAYTSCETDYDFANAYLGAKFFTTNVEGQSFTGEEVDTTPSGSPTRVLLTGYTGQPYQSLELDYTAGVYSAYKTFATGITGQGYTGLESDVTAAGTLTKVIYTGLKSTPYTTLEQDYTNGALTSSTLTFNASSGQSYSGFAVTLDAAGTQISETVNNTNGSHTIVGSADNLIVESLGNDRITGGGAGETFSFRNVFGHDTITDFAGHATGAGHDTIALQATDFGSFAAVMASAHNVSGGVAFAGKSGSQITLNGLDKATLAGLGADFVFRT